MAYGFADNKAKVEVLPKSFWTPKRPTYKSNIATGATLEMVQVGFIVFGTIKFTSGVNGVSVNMDGTNLPRPSAFVSTMGFSDGSRSVSILPVQSGFYYPTLHISSTVSSGAISFSYPVDAA